MVRAHAYIELLDARHALASAFHRRRDAQGDDAVGVGVFGVCILSVGLGGANEFMLAHTYI